MSLGLKGLLLILFLILMSLLFPVLALLIHHWRVFPGPQLASLNFGFDP
jgi:hypothetical protein